MLQIRVCGEVTPSTHMPQGITSLIIAYIACFVWITKAVCCCRRLTRRRITLLYATSKLSRDIVVLIWRKSKFYGAGGSVLISKTLKDFILLAIKLLPKNLDP